MNAWLGVVSADHVARGVSLGIGQVGHGKRAGLARMHAGDTIVYYSPVQRLGDKIPLRAFTAIGTVADGEIWQADEGEFRPFRRRVDWEHANPVRVADVMNDLDLTRGPNWGYQLRRGLVPLTPGDVTVLRSRMRITTP